MAKPYYVLCCLALLGGHSTFAQVIAKVTVKAGPVDRHHSIVRTPFNAEQGYAYKLTGQENGRKVKYATQVEDGMLIWRLEDLPAGTERQFDLVREKSPAGRQHAAAPEGVSYEEKDGGYTIIHGKANALHYRAETMDPPAGVDTAYRRGGFIHPVWTPSGKVLTQIHPKDHYHHLGIWSPWTDTEFEGKTVDFWNLAKRSGTVLPVASARNRRTSGQVFGGFRQVQDYVVLGNPDRTAMTEELEVIVYGRPDENITWDYNSTLQCASAAPITLNEYRYGGGFAIRGAVEWNNANSKVITSEGKTRKDADGSLARWFIIQGELKDGKGGLLVLSDPNNFNAPQPLRVCPGTSGQGNAAAGARVA
ncbi:DUF6807 family protein [Chitinophaga sp.]|uniref:DUF6807 family protein n=1 Tax=Chitinophaga sp. TaxID=1869181 RepID=UPI00261BC48D|nr:DUF6807 family protein [uncultured Chitinophaga sp.]